MVTFTSLAEVKRSPEDISATATTFCVWARRMRIEAAAFGAREHAAAAVSLRRCDDAGKQVGLDVLPLAAYRPLIERQLTT